MTEADLATRAPESDAQEGQGAAAPGDAADQNGPAMSEHCTTDRPTPAGETPRGELRKLGGIDIYLSKPETYPSNPSKLLLLLTSGTGLLSTNNQLQADKFADEGYVVVMPDLFGGNPAPSSANAQVSESSDETGSVLSAIKLKISEITKEAIIHNWLAVHTEEKVMPILDKVVHACEGEFADAIGYGGGFYAVGYCFGGRYILLLASERDEGDKKKQPDEEAGEAQGPAKKPPVIKAGAVAHPTLVKKSDFENLKAPISLVHVKNDPMFPDEMRDALVEKVEQGDDHEDESYDDVPHGFAVYGDYAESHIKDQQAKAHQQILSWLESH